RRPLEVLCVGRLAPMKGHQVLIAALGKLVAQGVDARLRLVGDGPERARLRHAVERLGLGARVDFLGALNQDEVLPHYAAADAFALASFTEGIPMVLMEAMASGVPCVASWVAGIPELIRHEVDGLLVPPSDATAL